MAATTSSDGQPGFGRMRARLFGPLERAARRQTLRQLAKARPHGMTDGESLLDFDEESTSGRRLWIASDAAVYVVHPPTDDNYGFRVRFPYEQIQRFDEVRTPDGVLARTLTVEPDIDGVHDVTGFFKRPRRDLTAVIRRFLEPPSST